jgi:PAS domain-containing protein
MAVRTGTPYEVLARLRRFDGEYRWCLSRAQPSRDKAGRIVKWYGTTTDINEINCTHKISPPPLH